MKKPKLFDAIEWIALNDLPDSFQDKGHITSCLVADLFDIEVEKVLKHVEELHKEVSND